MSVLLSNFPTEKTTSRITWGERGAAVPAAEGLGGSRDVGDAVHGGGRGARGRGHKDRQVWHLGQVNDACREKQEDCQDNAELLQFGRAGAGCASLTQPPLIPLPNPRNAMLGGPAA